MKKLNPLKKQIPEKEPNNIKDFDTISFDIFDTLVHRHVYAPVDVFEAVRSTLISSELALLHPYLVENFPYLRRTSEQEAREKYGKEHDGDLEITFDEIYDQLSLKYPMDISTRKFLQNTELKLEKLFLYKSQDGFAKYFEAVSLGKRILFISDMYLPQSFLIDILNNLGFQEASKETVFVSCEHRCSKYSGKLYQLVKEKLGLDKKKWLHFGDNVHADVEAARQTGLSAEQAEWSIVHNVPRNYSEISNALPESIIRGILLPQHRAIYIPENDYQKIGYEVFAPLIFGFYIWMRRKLTNLKADKILFFARDAYLIQKIDERLNLQQETPSEYVYLSRKSVYSLSLTDFPLWRVDFLVGSRTQRKLSTVCANYNVDLSKFSTQMAQFGLSPDSLIGEHNHVSATQFLSTCFQEIMLQSMKHREEFAPYFTDMLEGCKKVAIIDIGWAGNIQAALSRILWKDRNDIELSGFYLGLHEHSARNRSSRSKMSGWFCDTGYHPENSEAIAQGGAELLEFLLTSPDGSTLGYKKDEQGRIQPVLEEKNTQEKNYERISLEVQKGVLSFIDDYAFLLKEFPLVSLDSLKWSEPFFELVRNPSREQILLLADLTHSDGAGNNQSRLSLAPKLPLFDRLFRTPKYKQAYAESYWKKAFYYRNNRSPKKYRG